MRQRDVRLRWYASNEPEPQLTIEVHRQIVKFRKPFKRPEADEIFFEKLDGKKKSPEKEFIHLLAVRNV